MNLGVTFLLVAARELPAAIVAAERFLAGVRASVCGQVIAAAERAMADVAHEWLLTGVNADVTCEFIGTRKAAIAVGRRTLVRSFVHRDLARPIRVFPCFHASQLIRWRSRLRQLSIENVTWCELASSHWLISTCVIACWYVHAEASVHRFFLDADHALLCVRHNKLWCYEVSGC